MFFAGGFGFAWMVKADVKILAEKVFGLNSEVSQLSLEVKEISKAMLALVRQEERLNAADQRMILQGQRIDALNDKLNRVVERQMIPIK